MYLFKRILWLFPTLGIISLLAFAISIFSPIDPVETKCDTFSGEVPFEEVRKCMTQTRQKFNLYLPVFYLEVSNLAEPDTLYRIPQKSIRAAMERILDESGNWPAVQNYYLEVQAFYEVVGNMNPDSFSSNDTMAFQLQSLRSEMIGHIASLLQTGKPELINRHLESVEEIWKQNPSFSSLSSDFAQLKDAWETVLNDQSGWKVYIPRFIWHGTQCQYHQWIKNIITKGDFGQSYFASWRVGDRIGDLFFYSFFFTSISVLLAYLIGIGLGILSAWYHHRWPDKWIGISVFALDSMPSFWVATMLMIFFANPDRLNWFPSTFNITEGWSFLARITLPLIAYTYGAFAAISRIMRTSLLEVMSQDYITTARAKGLSEKKIMFKHALRNALLPMITLFAGVFPALLGGSVILERIYKIPGMGDAIIEAVLAKNIPMILAVFTLIGLLTIIGYLVSDLLYAWIDPRIRFGKK